MWSAYVPLGELGCGGLYVRWDDSYILDEEEDASCGMGEKVHSLQLAVLKSSSAGCACKDSYLD